MPELVKYAKGEVVPRLGDIAVARRGKKIYDEVRLAQLMSDGAMALAGHIMEGLIGLDEHRRSLSNGDPVTDVMLTQIQVEAIRSIGNIQRNLYSWGA